MNNVTISTVAMHVVHDKKRNLDVFLRYIEEANRQDVQLIVFPEQALQGYIFELNHTFGADEFAYHYENAESADSPYVKALIEASEKYNIVVIFGMTEDAKVAGHSVLYNSALIVGPGGLYGVFRKVHGPGDEYHVYNQGKTFPVFHTAVGKVGILLCYDICFPEAARELALQGADILAVCAAWPFAGESGENDPSFYIYDLCTRCRAFDNQIWVIASNHAGQCAKSGWHFAGHSRIILPNGQVLEDSGPKEGLVCSKVNIKESILKARTEDFWGRNLIKDRKPQLYRHISDEDIYYPDYRGGG